MVLKLPSSKKYLLESFNFNAFYHNKILFYKKYAKHYKNCPRLFYAFENPPLGSKIVIENVNEQGYFLNSQKINLDYKYIIAAIRELARFHATGYILKEKNPVEFFEIVKNIKNYRHTPSNKIPLLINSVSSRIMRYLRKENQEPVFCEKIEKILSDSYSNVIFGMSKPVEPFATLCHGDFTRNNIFFKENKGKIEVKLIDFAMMTYCSPFVDFSVFLLLTGTKEHRNEKFPEIFGIYCNTLLQSLKESGFTNFQLFSKERLLEDYKFHALYGFLTAAFFLPAMMGYFENIDEPLLSKEIQVICEIYDTIGGDKLTKIIVDMLLDLRDAGCLDHIVNL